MTMSLAFETAQPKQIGRWSLLGLIGAVIAGIALAAVALTMVVLVIAPGARLAVCPYCYGFERLQEKIYVESGTPPAMQQSVITAVQISRARVTEFFTTRQSNPVIFFCLTETCYRRAGGQGISRGMTFAGALLVSPRRPDGTVTTHEWTHEEVLERLGPNLRLVPAWFNEGLAVYVSDDKRFLAPAGSGDRCLIEPTGDLPETQARWTETTTYDSSVFARAGCRVSRWLARKGNGAVLELIRQINSGRSFADAYQ